MALYFFIFLPDFLPPRLARSLPELSAEENSEDTTTNFREEDARTKTPKFTSYLTGGGDESAKDLLLKFFASLGADHELVKSGRKRLTNLFFVWGHGEYSGVSSIRAAAAPIILIQSKITQKIPRRPYFDFGYEIGLARGPLILHTHTKAIF